ncbi:hypothetical protein J3Q64DRAFT_1730771, partial [Phycomyces blakesleeanus]
MKAFIFFALLVATSIGSIMAAPSSDKVDDPTKDLPKIDCIQVTYPTNGVVWTTGTVYNITWNVLFDCVYPKSVYLGKDVNNQFEFDYLVNSNLNITAGLAYITLPDDIEKVFHAIVIGTTEYGRVRINSKIGILV